MPILISIPDNCKALADAVTQLVASVDRTERRAAGDPRESVDGADVHVEMDDGEALNLRARGHDVLTADTESARRAWGRRRLCRDPQGLARRDAGTRARTGSSDHRPAP